MRLAVRLAVLSIETLALEIDAATLQRSKIKSEIKDQSRVQTKNSKLQRSTYSATETVRVVGGSERLDPSVASLEGESEI